MYIESEELIAMLDATLFAAKPMERASIEETIRTIREQKVVVSTGSEFSLWFQHVIAQFEPLFRSEIVNALRNTPIFGVQLPMVNAFARKDRMVIFEGILESSRFFADYTWVVNLLGLQVPNGTKISVCGSGFPSVEMDEATAFGYACLVLLEHFTETKNPLPYIGDLLGPNAQKCSMNAYVCTVAFIMAHELGHIMLGHTNHGQVIAKRNYKVAVGESLSKLKEQEFAADEFAIQSFREEHRPFITSYGMTFFSQRGFMDSMDERDDHPLGINRVLQVHDLMAGSDVYRLPEITETLTNLYRAMHGQGKSFELLTQLLDGLAMSPREALRQFLPVADALEIVRRVREQIEKSYGTLDTSLLSRAAQ